MPSFEDLQNTLQRQCSAPSAEFLALLKQLFAQGRESDAAFTELTRRADEFFDELVIVFEPIRSELAQREDGTYSWYHHALLECISCAHHPKALSILWQELHHPNEQARSVAIDLLGLLGRTKPQARKILREALAHRLGTTEETQRFQDSIRHALRNINTAP